MVTMQSRVNPAPSVLFRELDGEAVILELESGKYFGLDEVGTRFWKVVLDHPSLEQGLHALRAEYEVSEAQLERDLVEFVETLVARGLMHVTAV